MRHCDAVHRPRWRTCEQREQFDRSIEPSDLLKHIVDVCHGVLSQHDSQFERYAFRRQSIQIVSYSMFCLTAIHGHPYTWAEIDGHSDVEVVLEKEVHHRVAE